MIRVIVIEITKIQYDEKLFCRLCRLSSTSITSQFWINKINTRLNHCLTSIHVLPFYIINVPQY